jgi:hypothetical protein
MYALYQKLGIIPPNGTRFVTWYYGATSQYNLDAVINDLALTSTPAVIAGNAQATVSWTAPSTVDPITSYVIRYSSDNGQTWQPVVNVSPVPNPLSHVITGLTNGATYVVQVAAVTAAGQGPFSNSSLSFIPGRPVNVVRPTLGGGEPNFSVGEPS